MTLTSIPTVLPKGVRRRVAWRGQAGACSLRVPITTTNPKGDWIEGMFRVPVRLVRSKPDTNERHEFDQLVRSQIDAWVDFRAKKGWHIASTPKVTGPFDPPSKRTGDEVTDEVKWYFVMARFRRSEYLYVGLDDLLETQRQAEQFGLKPEADLLPWNDVGGTEDSGWVDPLKEAAASRARMGINVADYRVEELWRETRCP